MSEEKEVFVCEKGKLCKAFDDLIVESYSKGFQFLVTYNLKTGDFDNPSSVVLFYQPKKGIKNRKLIVVHACPFCGTKMEDIGYAMENYPDVYVRKTKEEIEV